MSFQTLPPELLSYIIALAPTSFSSVSVVSRSFHSLAAPFALNTLHVSGLDSIRRLLSLLESDKAQAEAEGRAYVGRVKHIFLCDVGADTASLPGVDDILRRSNPTAVTEAHGLLQAYSALLPLLAPSLVSLTMLSYNPHITPYRVILDTSFPRLQSLTTRFTAIPYVAEFDDARSPTMPSLTHLHLAFAASPTLCDEPIGLVKMAASCAPSLAEVKFTNVRLGRNSVPLMRKMLDIGRVGKVQRLESVMTLFETIQHGPGTEAQDVPGESQSDSDSDAETEVGTDAGSDESTDVENDGGDGQPASIRAVYVQPALPAISIPWWAAYQKEMVEELRALSREAVYEFAVEVAGRKERDRKETRRRTLDVLEPGRSAGGYGEWRRRWFESVGWEPAFGEVWGGEQVECEQIEGRASPTSPWRMY